MPAWMVRLGLRQEPELSSCPSLDTKMALSRSPSTPSQLASTPSGSGWSSGVGSQHSQPSAGLALTSLQPSLHDTEQTGGSTKVLQAPAPPSKTIRVQLLPQAPQCSSEV